MISLSSMAIQLVKMIPYDELLETSHEYCNMLNEEFKDDPEKLNAYTTRMKCFVQLREVLHHTEKYIDVDDLNVFDIKNQKGLLRKMYSDQ